MNVILCEKCGGYLIEYEHDGELSKFQHSVEQHTRCDGYRQVRVSEFEQEGVEEFV